MLLSILIAQLAALVLIAVFTGLALFGKLRKPEVPAASPVPVTVSEPESQPAGIRRDLAQVLTMRSGEWVHHGWAQEDSDAFQSALGQPGYAVKRHGQEIEYGRQC